jgi:hypothetical protein
MATRPSMRCATSARAAVGKLVAGELVLGAGGGHGALLSVVSPMGVRAVAADLVFSDDGRVGGRSDLPPEAVAFDRALEPVLGRRPLEAADLGRGLGLGARVGEGLTAAVGELAQVAQLPRCWPVGAVGGVGAGHADARAAAGANARATCAANV